MASDMAIRKQVISVLREIMSDPDQGLELTAYAKRRLAAAERSRRGGKHTPLAQVMAKYKSR